MYVLVKDGTNFLKQFDHYIQQQLEADKGGGNIFIGIRVKNTVFTISGRQSVIVGMCTLYAAVAARYNLHP